MHETGLGSLPTNQFINTSRSRFLAHLPPGLRYESICESESCKELISATHKNPKNVYPSFYQTLYQPISMLTEKLRLACKLFTSNTLPGLQITWQDPQASPQN